MLWVFSFVIGRNMTNTLVLVIAWNCLLMIGYTTIVVLPTFVLQRSSVYTCMYRQIMFSKETVQSLHMQEESGFQN